jgi:N-acetylmuramoyl-L-alanine amidase
MYTIGVNQNQEGIHMKKSKKNRIFIKFVIAMIILGTLNLSLVPKSIGVQINKKYCVVIDAGHGGAEPGAVYWNVKEKDLNLDIAKRLSEILRANNVDVIMTRNSDVTVNLYQRSGYTRNPRVDLFISIHNNASLNSAAYGTMTLYNSAIRNKKGTLSSKMLAEIILSNLVRGLPSKRLGTIKRTNLAVLRTSNVPAIIAEIGFMSNRNELNKLQSISYKQRTAESLAKGIIQALKMVKNNSN